MGNARSSSLPAFRLREPRNPQRRRGNRSGVRGLAQGSPVPALLFPFRQSSSPAPDPGNEKIIVSRVPASGAAELAGDRRTRSGDRRTRSGDRGTGAVRAGSPRGCVVPALLFSFWRSFCPGSRLRNARRSAFPAEGGRGRRDPLPERGARSRSRGARLRDRGARVGDRGSRLRNRGTACVSPRPRAGFLVTLQRRKENPHRVPRTRRRNAVPDSGTRDPLRECGNLLRFRERRSRTAGKMIGDDAILGGDDAILGEDDAILGGDDAILGEDRGSLCRSEEKRRIAAGPSLQRDERRPRRLEARPAPESSRPVGAGRADPRPREVGESPKGRPLQCPPFALRRGCDVDCPGYGEGTRLPRRLPRETMLLLREPAPLLEGECVRAGGVRTRTERCQGPGT